MSNEVRDRSTGVRFQGDSRHALLSRIVLALLLSVLTLVVVGPTVSAGAATPTRVWSDQEIAAALSLGIISEVTSESCPSATFCAAGGFYTDSSGHRQSFVATWNGSAWSSQELGGALNVGGTSQVTSVSCPTSTFCVTGGFYRDSVNHIQSFVATWNGSTWSDQEIVSTLNLGGASKVTSVSCPSATFCVAGGSYYDSANIYQSFVATWNGSTWSDQEIAGALNAGGTSEVTSVSCSTSTFCVAGGFYYDSANIYQSFVATWNGSAWSSQEVAGALNVGGPSQVTSVSCVSPAFCVAGGYYRDSANNYQAFVATWNGSGWTSQEVAASLNAGGTSEVTSVSCSTSTFCVAGGLYTDASGHSQAFVSMSSVSASLSTVVLSGTPTVGQTLTAVSSGVAGVPTPTPSYQWLANGVAIPGATSSSYALTSANYGQSISVKVSETNSLGAVSLTSSAVTVTGLAPTISSATVSGTPTVGQTLTALSGGVTGVPTPTASYQWLANGVAIPGATGSTYVLQPKNVLERVSVTITETSPAGRVSLTSPSSLLAAPRYGALSTPLSHLFRGSSSRLDVSKKTLAQLERLALSLRATGGRLLLLDHVTYSTAKNSSHLRALAQQLGKKRMRILVKELVTLAHREGVTLHVTTKVLVHSLKGLKPSARRLWTSVELET